MTGPIERAPWPARLTARVVDAKEGRIHGYAIADDLAVNYSFAEQILLSLTGEAPPESVGRAFECALSFSSLVSAGDAQTHAATVAQLCATEPKNVVAIAAVLGAERVANVLRGHEAFLIWLDNPAGSPPAVALGTESAALALMGRLPDEFRNSAPFDAALTLTATVIATLHRCGLTTRERMTAALTVASLAVSAAEALATPALGFRDYPMTLPPFAYEEDPK